MCLILFAWKAHPRYRLVVAANRDEFRDRASAPADFWDEAPDVLAGRDLVAGGTWLGITRTGRWAAVTNYREAVPKRSAAPSRGRLVARYLCGSEDAEVYARGILPEMDRYNGFTLVLGDAKGIVCLSNRGSLMTMGPGIHGISNHLPDTPWPKVSAGKKALESLLAGTRAISPEAVMDILADRTVPPDELLPETGVGLAWERILAPRFVDSPEYGTRSSTVLIIDRQGWVTFRERLFEAGARPCLDSQFRFRAAGKGV